MLGYLETWVDEADNDQGITDEEWINACEETEEKPEEEPFRGAKMGFLKSPVEVDPWEPVALKDSYVSPEA